MSVWGGSSFCVTIFCQTSDCTVVNVNVSKTRHLRLGECGKLDIAVILSVSNNFKKYESN